MTAGLLLATRGFGTFVAMMLVGRIMRFIEARTLIASGMLLMSASLYFMTGWTDQTGVPTIIVVSVAQGFGLGLVFVPLSTVAFMTLAGHLRTDGTSMLTLVRNVASSVGISVVTAKLTEGGREAYAIINENVTPFNQPMQMPDVSGIINMGTDAGRAIMDTVIGIQAQIIAFSWDYQMVMIITLLAAPLAVMIGSTKAVLRQQSQASDHAAVME